MHSVLYLDPVLYRLYICIRAAILCTCVLMLLSCFLCLAEFSKMKDELPDSFRKGLESAEKEEAQKATPTSATPSEKTSVATKEATPTDNKDKVVPGRP